MGFCLWEMCVEKTISGRHENTNLGASFFPFMYEFGETKWENMDSGWERMFEQFFFFDPFHLLSSSLDESREEHVDNSIWESISFGVSYYDPTSTTYTPNFTKRFWHPRKDEGGRNVFYLRINLQGLYLIPYLVPICMHAHMTHHGVGGFYGWWSIYVLCTRKHTRCKIASARNARVIYT